MADEETTAVLVGGPRDGAVVTTRSPLIEQDIDGLVHRYILTKKTRELNGQTLRAYNYDGEVNPRGAMPGAETRTPRNSPGPNAGA